MRHMFSAVLLVLSLAPAAAAQDDAALLARARAIHERVITLDTHDDIDALNFTRACNYTQRLSTQVDLPKMQEGGLDVAFFIVYVGQGPLTPEGYADAYRQAVEKFEAVHRLTDEIASDQIELALSPADVRRIAASGKKVAVIGIENGYQMGTDIARLKEFYDRGGRYMSLAHNGASQLSDSNNGETTGLFPHGGLSPLGRQVIAEMNRLGMMIDVSHPSKASIMQTLELSRAPVIASHSSVRALANHSRNMDDEMLLALKKNGGVIQMVAFNGYVKVPPAEAARARTVAITALQQELGVTTAATGAARPCPVERPEFTRRMAEIDQTYPRASVRDFVDHIDYAVKLIGLDHVGISSDFDGGGGVDGWNSAAETFNVTLELVRRGYTEEQIGKLWSGNLLRVWSEVERVARESSR
jgi:membrane dipeptidase